ncbi:uncharacterized protein LOC135499822 isoform X2 [Lineus longissimus]|uniref:uncharacterized protein LOC135499822 isoform X2 n=1 Tax=Lineus longissimus TaxID=88925 RepID=UPI00315C64E6
MREKESIGLPAVETSGKELDGDPPPLPSEDMPALPLHKRQDFWAWIGNLLFFLGLAGAIWGIGNAKGWYAPSGYAHNESETSQQRFLKEPITPEPGVRGRDGVGASGRWYYWRLKPEDQNIYTHLFVWMSYVAHQLFAWTALYLAQYFKNLPSATGPRFSTNLEWYNWMGIAINIGFHLLHLLQTHTTYDALAADVAISSSQCSVIMLIIYIFIIEYRDRGYAFGWPSQYDTGCATKVRLTYGPMYLVRKYHGYAFSWGAIYTFWYHPMENTWGHVLGFAHTYMILVQGSLVFTKMHLNKYWRFILETWVTLHGSLVAYQTGGPDHVIWPMFCFGFSTMVVVTQIFTLPFWRKIPVWVRPFPALILLAVIIYCYSWIPDAQGRYFVGMIEVIFIPALLLLAPLAIWFLLWLYLKVEEKCKNRNTDSQKPKRNLASSILFFLCSITILSSCTVIGFLIQYFDTKMTLPTMMPILSFAYSIIVSIQLIVSKQMFPCTDIMPRKVAPADYDVSDEKEKET